MYFWIRSLVTDFSSPDGFAKYVTNFVDNLGVRRVDPANMVFVCFCSGTSNKWLNFVVNRWSKVDTQQPESWGVFVCVCMYVLEKRPIYKRWHRLCGRKVGDAKNCGRCRYNQASCKRWYGKMGQLRFPDSTLWV